MLLTDLLANGAAMPAVEITNVVADSRAVKPGALFAAMPGSIDDGRAYIRDAINKGAAAVLVPSDFDTEVPVPCIRSQNVRRRYAEICAAFEGEKQPEQVIAVTGTNGKTSVADFLRQLWSLMGEVAASIGTLGVRTDDEWQRGSLTTPDPAHIHKALAGLAARGIQCCALEASSHGLDQYRLAGTHLSAGVFTNLSRDHLDYHGTETAYLFAKARLFGELLNPGQPAIIDMDTPSGQTMVDLAWGRGLDIWTTGAHEKARVRLVSQKLHMAGQSLEIALDGEVYKVELPLIGAFQGGNALSAATALIALGAAPDAVFKALGGLKAVPGRMDYQGQTLHAATIYVDYAHTPDALKNVLEAVREHCASQVHIVFGCGGNRDVGKRPEMGAIAGALADAVYVTDDNPRDDDPANIRAQVMAGCPGAIEIADRGEAIAAALRAASLGDIVVVAGKGHELGQVGPGGEVTPFSDMEAIKDHLMSERMGVAGHAV